MKRWLAIVLVFGCTSRPISAGDYFVTGLDQYGAPPNCGTSGQLLTSNGNCGTSWTTVGVPSDTAYTDVNNNFSAVQTFPAGTASAPGISIGESNTGFYNSGSHQVSFTSNGTARIDFIANGIGNANTSDTAGIFFSGADLDIEAGNTGIFRFENGNTGQTVLTINNVNGNVFTQGGTAPRLASCGSSPSITGTNFAMTVTAGAGATGCSIGFSTVFVSTPTCVLSEQTENIVNALSYTVNPSTITLTQTGFAANTVNIICVGQTN